MGRSHSGQGSGSSAPGSGGPTCWPSILAALVLDRMDRLMTMLDTLNYMPL